MGDEYCQINGQGLGCGKVRYSLCRPAVRCQVGIMGEAKMSYPLPKPNRDSKMPYCSMDR